MSSPRTREKSRIDVWLGVSGSLTGWLMPTTIILLTVLTFLQVLWSQFLNWDDGVLLVTNPHYRGFGWKQLGWMFTTFHMGHYKPLSWLTYALDYSIWGMNPLGYHLTNLLLHSANAVVFYLVALRLFSLGQADQSQPASYALRFVSALSALLFALHPLRVESVAWATERRDVLSALFFLSTILCYLKAVGRGKNHSESRGWMAVAVLLYALSLLSKVSVLTLPFVLLIMDFYPLRRLATDPRTWFEPQVRRIGWEKVPFFLLAIAAGAVGLVALHQSGAMRSFQDYGLLPRVTQSIYSLAFYVSKTIMPLNLSPLYELPTDIDVWRWPFLTSGFFVVVVSVGLFMFRKRWPAGIASSLYYTVMLAPVLGIFQNGPQIVADRYSYLSCLGWVLLIGAGVLTVWKHFPSAKAKSQILLLHGSSALVVFILVTLTWQQTRIWHDSETLWRYVLASGKESAFAYNNLGQALATQGRLEEAVEQFRRALRINPLDLDAQYNLGNALAKQGHLEQASVQLQETLRLAPDYAMARYDLGIILAGQGQLEQAADQFQKTLQLLPHDARVHYNLGNILLKQAKFEQAADHFRQALRVNPSHVKARYYLAVSFAQKGDLKEAVESFEEVLRMEPGLAEAHVGLARVLATQGKKDEAVRHYQEAVRLVKSSREEMGLPNNMSDERENVKIPHESK